MLNLNPPAIVAPADADLNTWLAEQYEPQYLPSGDDVIEAMIADALTCTPMRKLLIASRNVLRTNGRDGGAMAELASIVDSLCEFGVIEDERPARVIPTGTAPF